MSRFTYLSIILALSLSFPAAAGTFRYQRTEYRKDGTPVTTNSVAVTGFTPNQPVTVGLGMTSRRSKSSCLGWARVDLVPFPVKPTALLVGSASYAVATAPVLNYACLKPAPGKPDNGVFYDEWRQWEFAPPNFFKSGIDGFYYAKVPSLSTYGTDIEVGFSGAMVDRAVKADACGVVTVRDSKAAPWTDTTSIKVATTTYTVGQIAVGVLPRCIRNGNTYSLYLPN